MNFKCNQSKHSLLENGPSYKKKSERNVNSKIHKTPPTENARYSKLFGS
jgi:hypothetical protein